MPVPGRGKDRSTFLLVSRRVGEAGFGFSRMEARSIQVNTERERRWSFFLSSPLYVFACSRKNAALTDNHAMHYCRRP